MTVIRVSALLMLQLLSLSAHREVALVGYSLVGVLDDAELCVSSTNLVGHGIWRMDEQDDCTLQRRSWSGLEHLESFGS